MEAEYIDPIRELYTRDVGCLDLFPWFQGRYFSLEEMFTRLIMRNRDKKKGSLTGKVIEMSAIFKPHENCPNPRTVLIEGDPGMGKTTYCNKLAFDWATGEDFLKFKLVLLLRCCDINSNLSDAIVHQILPSDMQEQEREKFFDFIKRNQSNILLVLDGLDELPSGKLPEIQDIIKGKIAMLHKCPLVVTARHEAGTEVMKYCDTLLEIEGFTGADASEFIQKFFHEKGEQGAKMAQNLLGKLEEDQSLKSLWNTTGTSHNTSEHPRNRQEHPQNTKNTAQRSNCSRLTKPKTSEDSQLFTRLADHLEISEHFKNASEYFRSF